MIRGVWNYIRTIIFYTLGIMNTIFIRPEDVGTLKNYIGYILLLLAIMDTIFKVKYLKPRNQYSWITLLITL